MRATRELFFALETVFFSLSDIKDWESPKWQTAADLEEFFEDLEAASPARLTFEIEAANRLHASTTGPVRDGEWYGNSWLEVAAKIIDFVLWNASEAFPDPIGIHQAVKEALQSIPNFDAGWLCMVVKHDCERISIGREIVGRKLPLSAFQNQIISELDGAAFTKEKLCVALGCDGKKLYRPHGIKELIDRGLVKNERGIGYYRPDAPPDSDGVAPQECH